jgi:hypothetical protein
MFGAPEPLQALGAPYARFPFIIIKPSVQDFNEKIALIYCLMP